MSETITQEQIEEYRKARAAAFTEQLTAICEEFGCELVAIPTFTNDGRVAAQIVVQPK